MKWQPTSSNAAICTLEEAPALHGCGAGPPPGAEQAQGRMALAPFPRCCPRSLGTANSAAARPGRGRGGHWQAAGRDVLAAVLGRDSCAAAQVSKVPVSPAGDGARERHGAGWPQDPRGLLHHQASAHAHPGDLHGQTHTVRN